MMTNNNMRKILLTLIALAFLTQTLWAQNSYLLNYDWKDKPEYPELSEADLELNELYISHKIVTEIFYLSDNSAIEYYMEHIIKRVNSETAIDNNNKVYLPGTQASPEEYTVVEQARVIKPNGDIIELEEDEILEEINEEEGVKYRYFALNNVQEGDQIEYMYIYPRSPQTNGKIYKLQTDLMKKHVEVINITPSNLINSFKSFNGFPELEQDEDEKDFRYFSAIVKDLQPLSDEDFADRQANRAAFAYYLESNTKSSYKADFYTQISKSISEIISSIDLKKDGILKYVKGMDLDKSAGDESIIKQVENYIKDDISYQEESYEVLSEPKSIIKNKVANEIGIIKLYGGVFKSLEIPYEVVFTSDRTELKFDEEFECGIFIDEPLFYFKEIDKFISVTALNSRLGFIPGSYFANYGYFTKFVQVGDISAGVGKVKYIPEVPSDETIDKFTVEVNFDELPSANVTIHREQTGYNALTYQYILDLVDEENRVEIEESLIKYLDEDMELDEVEVENSSIEDFGKKPLVADGSFTSTKFVSKIGNKYLINVGLLIGPQAEMYQSTERILPVSNANNREYDRTIIINIPDGYKLENLDSLVIDKQYKHDGEKDLGFVSSYTLEGNILKIKCWEYYNRIYYPVSEYAKFEEVINAAADFNKIKIVLEKI